GHVLAAADDAVAEEAALAAQRLAVVLECLAPRGAELQATDRAADASLGFGAPARSGARLGLLPVGGVLLGLRDTRRVGLDGAGRVDPAAPVAEVRLPLLREPGHGRRVAALVVEREVLDVRAARALRLVEVVRAVPGVGLRAAVVLDDRADPVVALEVEAFRRGRCDARRLERQELDDTAFAHVLVALVVLDAERVGV